MKRCLTLFLLSGAFASAFAQTGGKSYEGCVAKLKAAQSLSCNLDVVLPGVTPQTWKVRLLKPNFYEVVAPDQQFRSDGKKESSYLTESKTYQYLDSGPILEAPFAVGLNAFFSTSTPYTEVDEKPVQLDGRTVTAVSISHAGLDKSTTLFLDPKTLLPVGYDQPLDEGSYQVRYRDVKLNEPMQPASFAWNPPADAKPMLITDYEAKLIKPDETAPVLPATDINGSMVNMAEVFKTHRATLLYFWGGPAPFPDEEALRKLADQLKDQRLQIIAIDFSPHPAEAKKALLEAKLPFPVLVEDKNAGYAKAYGVDASGEYIVGPTGKVVANFLSHDPQALAARLRVLGFKV